MIWLMPVLLIVALVLVAWVTAGTACPMTDQERFYFNGDPERCITCGRPMKRTEFDGTTSIRCPMYTPGSEHEFYRWKDSRV